MHGSSVTVEQRGRAVIERSTWAERLAHAVEKTSIDGGESGALIERVVLADGSTCVVKTEKMSGFSLAHIAGDDGRLLRLWEAKVFDRMPPVIDHAMVAVERTPDGWLIVMRDVADALLNPDVAVPRADARRALEAIVAVHDAFRDSELPELCSLSTYAALAPPPDMPPVPTEFMRKIRAGWDRFGTLAAPDVWEALEAIRREPGSLIGELESCSTSLVHGDFWLRNVGLGPDRVVILDWGNLTLCARHSTSRIFC